MSRTTNPYFVFEPELPQDTLVLPISIESDIAAFGGGFVHKLHLTKVGLISMSIPLIKFSVSVDIGKILLSEIVGDSVSGWAVNLSETHKLGIIQGVDDITITYIAYGVIMATEVVLKSNLEKDLLILLKSIHAI